MKVGEHNYIQQMRMHNEKALCYVIDRYGGLIMSIIRKHLFGMPYRWEECFDDVLMNLWMNISAFDETKNSFQNWAAAVARYRCIDYLRQYRRELETVDLAKAADAGEDSMLSGMIEKEISEEVEAMLDFLKPADRELFLKLYVEEKSVDQVSEETGLKKEMIYNRLSRGKRKLRKHFSEERSVSE